MQNKICNTCGGECKVIKENASNCTVRCVCCGNEYTYDKNITPVQPTQQKPLSVEIEHKDSGEAVFEKCVDSVIAITCSIDGDLYAGSGFAIGDSGYAITNAHVVMVEGKTADFIEAYVCGESVPAQIVVMGDNGTGIGEDLALIKLNNVPEQMHGVKFSDKVLRNGQRLFVIGNALGMGTCITSGIISDKLRIIEGKHRLMTDCAVNQGNSGGPVFDETGKVIGVVVAGIDNAEGMNFAIPADVVLEFIKGCATLVPDLKFDR